MSTPDPKHEPTTTNDELSRAVPKDDVGTEAARAAFLAKLADPPANVASEIRDASAEEADTEDPKAPAAAVSPKATTPSASSSSTKPAAGTASTPDAVLAALKAGDLDAIADLTGADPSEWDESSVKWAARNRREARIQRDLAQVKADARQLLEHYEPIDQQQAAFDRSGGKDFAPVRAIVEHITGKPWHVVAPNLGLASGGPSPSAPSPAAERVLVEAVRDDVPDDHQVRQLPGWESRVVAVLREHIDDATGEPSISFRQAAARAVRRAKEEHAKLAPLFGGTAPAATPKANVPERAESPTPGKKRALTKEEFYARFGR